MFPLVVNKDLEAIQPNKPEEDLYMNLGRFYLPVFMK